MKAKFIRLLEALSNKELTAFIKFLKDRYSKEQLLISVVEYYKKYHPNMNVDEVEKKEFIRDLLFKGQEVKNVSNAHSNLAKLLQKFLLQEAVENDQLVKDSCLLNIYYQRGLDKDFDDTQKSIIKRLKKDDIKDDIALLAKLQMLELEYHRPSNKMYDPKMNDKILALDNALNANFYLRKLKIVCELLSRSTLTPNENNLAAHLKIIDLLTPSIKTKEFPTLRGYFLVYKKYTNKQLDVFDELFTLIQNNTASITKKDLLNLLMYLINFSALKIKDHDSSYFQKSLEVWKFGDREDLYAVGGQLDTDNLHNIIDTACGLKDFEWATLFLEKWQRDLPEEERDDAVRLSKARIAFGQNQHDEVIDILKDCSTFKQLSGKVRARILNIRSHYLLHHSQDSARDFLLSQVAAYRTFIIREKKLKKNVSEAFKHFLKALELLIKKEKNKEIVKQAIQKKPIHCHGWLLEQLAHYKVNRI